MKIYGNISGKIGSSREIPEPFIASTKVFLSALYVMTLAKNCWSLPNLKMEEEQFVTQVSLIFIGEKGQCHLRLTIRISMFCIFLILLAFKSCEEEKLNLFFFFKAIHKYLIILTSYFQ